jgi:predicted TIM-barrel fold metal-dependent hydrolase
VARFAAAGFKGIKMHRPKYNWDDFGYFPIYEPLQQLNLVAFFHTGIVAGSGTGEPEQSSKARMRPTFHHTIARSFQSSESTGPTSAILVRGGGRSGSLVPNVYST